MSNGKKYYLKKIQYKNRKIKLINSNNLNLTNC